MEFNELLKIAKSLVNERRLSKLTTVGTVAAVLLTDKGNIYTGICIDAPAGMVLCAERTAIATMIMAGESRIVKMVATGVDDIGACAPCGICREFINAIHDENYKCEVLLEDGLVITIEKLLPYRL